MHEEEGEIQILDSLRCSEWLGGCLGIVPHQLSDTKGSFVLLCYTVATLFTLIALSPVIMNVVSETSTVKDPV